MWGKRLFMFTILKSALSLRRYEIRNQHVELRARAETDWAFINYATQKPMRIPAAVAESFETVALP